MPNPIFAKFEGIDGSCTVKDREGQVTVVQMTHTVDLPVDVKDSTATGTRRHGAMTLICNIDAATPQLMDAVCKSTEIPSVVLTFWRMDGAKEDDYYKITLKKVRVVKGEHWFPNVDDAATTTYKHMMSYDLRYQTIEWAFKEGNKAASDDWTVPNV